MTEAIFRKFLREQLRHIHSKQKSTSIKKIITFTSVYIFKELFNLYPETQRTPTEEVSSVKMCTSVLSIYCSSYTSLLK